MKLPKLKLPKAKFSKPKLPQVTLSSESFKASAGKVAAGALQVSKLALNTINELNKNGNALNHHGDLRDNMPGQSLLYKIDKLKDNKTSNIFLKMLDENIITDEEKSWVKGYEGEALVGAELNKLKPKGYTVLHSVPIGKRGADIDHLVFTPSGKVWVINTKHHSEASIIVNDHGIKVNGIQRPHIIAALEEVEKVQEKLKSTKIAKRNIQPMLVFVNAKEVKIIRRPPVKITDFENVLQQISGEEPTDERFTLLPLRPPEKVYRAEFWGGRILPSNLNYHVSRSQVEQRIMLKEALELVTQAILPAVYEYLQNRQAKNLKKED